MGFALVVAVLSLAGAAIPLRFRPAHAGLQIYLSLAAGALLGAALFHLLPEAADRMPESFGIPAAVGLVGVFLLQRYVAPHSHESSAAAPVEPPTHAHHHTSEPHEHLRAAGPFLGELIAILALSIHSFVDGVAIGAASGDAHSGLVVSVVLSVLIHKPMDGLSVSVLLLNAKTPPRTLWLIQAVYAALVPIGAGAFLLTRGALAQTLQSPFVGLTLAFSAGTFLSIALADLLPEVSFHTHDRNKLSVALLAGIMVMLLTRLIEHAT